MSRRIGFIAPVDHLSGNLSGDQVLKYAQNDNPAFDAPMGKQYARNYKTRYIGAIRASNGQPYFSVRTKNAVNINNRSKMVMALLGGTASVKQAIKKNSAYAGVAAQYAAELIAGYTDKTLDKWLFEIIYMALETKEVMIVFTSHTGGTSFAFHNPWVYTNEQAGIGIDVPARIIAKFWMQLAADPIQFYVNGMKGVAHTTDSFSDILPRDYNVLGLSAGDVVSGKTPIKKGPMFVCFDYNNVKYQAIGNRDIKDQLDSGVDTLDFYLSETIGQIPD